MTAQPTTWPPAGVRWYYADDAVAIAHGDCREIVPGLGRFERVYVSDPPYGCKATTGWGGKYDGFSIAGDNDTTLRDWLIETAGDAWIVFGSPRIPRPDCDAVLIWSKGEHTGMGDLSFPWKPDFEEIHVKGKVFSGPRTSSVLRHNARIDSGRLHPTEKPIGLMLELVSKCPKGATIIDPFCGGGSTLRAAKDLGRRAIGIEINEAYAEIAARRMAQGVLDLGGV